MQNPIYMSSPVHRTTFCVLLLVVVGFFTWNEHHDFLSSLLTVRRLEENSPLTVIEEHSPNCSIKVITNRSDLKSYLSTKWNNRTCSLRSLKDYFLTFGQFYGDGAWFAPPDGKLTQHTAFYPQSCHFPGTFQKKKQISECVKRGLRYVVVSGDSNGRHTAEALTGVMRSQKYKCIQKRNSAKNRTQYFHTPHVPDRNLVIHPCVFRNKHACDFFQYECLDQSSKTTLKIEYVPVFHVSDSAVHLYFNSVQDSAPISAEIQLEFLLKYYFPYRGFPDLWIFKPPFHHESFRHSYQKMELDFKYVFGLFDMYLPNTTQVIFMTAAPECESRQPKYIGPNFVKAWKTAKNTKMFRMNQMFYNILLPEVTKRSNYHVFMDAPRMICPVKCSWHADGAHLRSPWYAKLSTYLLELFCELKTSTV